MGLISCGADEAADVCSVLQPVSQLDGMAPANLMLKKVGR